MSLNLGNDTRSAANNSTTNTQEESRYAKYEPKQNKKIIRLLTVIAYVISVSMAAIILSLYYVFLWDPKMKYKPKSTSTPPSPKLSDDNFITNIRTNNQSFLDSSYVNTGKYNLNIQRNYQIHF